MKPIRLSLSAFGPYAGCEVVDFRAVHSLGLFLIHGDTGSGKSTLLDGLCFALFGRSAVGEKAQTEWMRSDLAADDRMTEVTLDFALGEKRYRIHRVPVQMRPKRRGGGWTEEKPDAVLSTWSQGGAEPDRVIQTGYDKVTSSVEELLGFKAEQFRQIVMLPQGRFRELLTVKTHDRQILLEKLFAIDKHSSLQRQLKQRADAERKLMERTLTREMELLSAALGEDADKDEPVNRSALDGLIERNTQTVEALTKRETEVRAELQDSENRWAKGRRDAAALERLGSAESVYQTMMEKTDEQQERGERLERGHKAAALLDIRRAVDERLRGVDASETQLSSAVEQKRIAGEVHVAAQEAMGAHKNQEEQREQARRDVMTLESMEVRVQALEEAQTQQVSLREQWNQNSEWMGEEEVALKTALSEFETATAQVEQAQKANACLPALKQSAQEARRALEVRRNLDAVREALKGHREESLLADSALREAMESAEKSKAAVEDCIEEMFRGRAGYLVKHHLVAGEPCPVCGGSEHPDPAAWSEDAPGDEDLQRVQQGHMEAEEVSRGLLVAKNKWHARVIEAEAKEKVLLDGGEAVAEMSLETLALNSDAANEACEETRKEAEPLKDWMALLESRTGAVTQARERLEARNRVVSGLQTELATAQALVDERGSGIPEALCVTGALQAALSARRNELAALNSEWDKARTDLENAINAMQTLEALVVERQRILDNTQKEADEARTAWVRRRNEAGFEDEEEFESARLEEGVLAGLEHEVARFREALAAAREHRLICLADAKGIEPPDLLELQTTAETHKQELGEVQTQLGRYQERLRHLLQHRSALDELVQERHAQQEHLQVLQRLSGIANGYLMDGSRGITFSRWVLGAMLDDVLAHASIRLSTMSSNRFAFKRRVDVARGTRAGQGGLDLDVIDSFSGKVRAANTLSGGEGFLAALALALGLADVVQGERGGVHIEAMFVDEGFGSLDPGALDLAIQTLLNLRKGGRMVGIISHVPELISRLDARLKVTATQDGSLTQWVLP